MPKPILSSRRVHLALGRSLVRIALVAAHGAAAGCAGAQTDGAALPTASPSASAPEVVSSAKPPIEIPDPAPRAILSTLPTLENLAELGSTMKAPSATWDLWELVPTPLRAPAGGPIADAPIAIYTVSLAQNQRVVYPSAPSVDVIGVVVEGAIKMHPMDESGGASLSVWQGFRAPEANVELVNDGKSTARIVIAVAMNPPGSPLLAHLPTTAPEKPKPRGMFAEARATQAAPPRAKRVDVIDFPTRRLLTWGDGAYHARIGFEASSYDYKGPDGKAPDVPVTDVPPAVVDAMIFSEDARVATHVHDKEWECIVALIADGDLLIAESAAATPSPVPIKDGTVHCVPPNQHHAWKPRGTKPFVALQFYAAPGPEQRFKKLAASEQQ